MYVSPKAVVIVAATLADISPPVTVPIPQSAVEPAGWATSVLCEVERA